MTAWHYAQLALIVFGALAVYPLSYVLDKLFSKDEK
jgi:hypothetical protein